MRNLQIMSSTLAAVVLVACAHEPTEPDATEVTTAALVRAPGPGEPITATGPVHFHPRRGEVTTTQSVEGMANVGKRFLSVEIACLDFEFAGDLLDDGDEMNIAIDGNDAGGFSLPAGAAPQGARTLCWIPGHDAVLAAVLDGKARLRFTAWSGSMTVSSVSMTIIGTPR